MKVLVIGSGGREHALVWKISKSPLVRKIYCAPGNPGIAELAQNVEIPVEDTPSLLKFAKSQGIDLTVVGPELPLTLGIVDEFEHAALRIFGPVKNAARLEGSKIFTRQLMSQYDVPTIGYEIFSDLEKAKTYLEICKFPVVIKADGLAAGKGVLITKDKGEALKFLDQVMREKIFGKSGENILFEEYLEGKEVSVLALLDGKTVLCLPAARDHKRVFDQDQGLNTGGMGAYSPLSDVKPDLIKKIQETIFYPIHRALLKEGTPYRGVLYAGLMLTTSGPKLLEFNVRFGDPETQAILPRIKNDLVSLMLACCEGKLSEMKLEVSSNTSLCVVLTAGGYPGAYKNGSEIIGLEEASQDKNVIVFHAGTKKNGNKCVTQGGRVLGITGLGKDMEQAREHVYKAINKIRFEKMHYRKDIGTV